MVKYTKHALIKNIMNESVKDGSYWIIDDEVFRLNIKKQCLISQSSPRVIYGFKFSEMKDIIYELVNYEVKDNE